jgi:protein required for attachment to host cells
MKPRRTWVLVADAASARVYEKAGKDDSFHEIESLRLTHDHRASHEIGSDRPGRVVESQGAARHSVEPKTDPHRELKRSFAAELAERLSHAAGEKKFDRLVVVLPPVMLGDFRANAPDALKPMIAGELDKDLTKASRDDIEKHVAALVTL